MSDYGKLAAERTDQYFAALDAAQQNFLKSFATLSASMPASPLSPPSAIPGVPTVQEVIEASFAFAQEFLSQQQSFMQKLMTTTTPSEAPTASTVAFGKAVSPKNKSAN